MQEREDFLFNICMKKFHVHWAVRIVLVIFMLVLLCFPAVHVAQQYASKKIEQKLRSLFTGDVCIGKISFSVHEVTVEDIRIADITTPATQSLLEI